MLLRLLIVALLLRLLLVALPPLSLPPLYWSFRLSCRCRVSARLASGGDGGSSATAVALAGRHAAPGGGGSGGAVLLQAQEVSLGGAPGRIDVTGGRGGSWLNTSFGGDGGIGLVRIETSTGEPLDGSSAAHDVSRLFSALAT